MEQFFTSESFLEVFIPIIGGFIYFLVTVLKKQSSTETDRALEERPHIDREPINNPFEEIRGEILRKKKEREELKKTEVILAMEADKARKRELGKATTEAYESSQFQAHMEKQSQRIKEKQEEAKQLKIHLEQINKGHLKGKAKKGHISNSSVILARRKVRSILAKKSNIKVALIAGEILAQPLALRTETSSTKSYF